MSVCCCLHLCLCVHHSSPLFFDHKSIYLSYSFLSSLIKFQFIFFLYVSSFFSLSISDFSISVFLDSSFQQHKLSSFFIYVCACSLLSFFFLFFIPVTIILFSFFLSYDFWLPILLLGSILFSAFDFFTHFFLDFFIIIKDFSYVVPWLSRINHFQHHVDPAG